MPEAVDWQQEDAPRSPRFADIYASCAGGLAQARQVFLRGCDLPQAWSGRSQWCVLETGFGLGLNFLATWQAWERDPQRPGLLHFVSVEAYPVSAADLLRSAASQPELLALAQELCAQWHDWTPGWQRLSLAGGRVLLTLCVGDVKAVLRGASFFADNVFLDGFSPLRNPDMWDTYALKAVARCCRRGTRLATWTVARDIRDRLSQCGFALEMVAGLAPKRDRLQGVFAPRWELKSTQPGAAVAPGHCLVIGAGLAGAAVAASLARRGWQVSVLDAADHPAAGASGLPAGLVVPHISADDSVLSRLTRVGARAMWLQAQRLLQAEQDYALCGVRERILDGPPDASEHWHAGAGWLKPAQLVHALLAQPGIRWQGRSAVQQLQRVGDRWQALDAAGALLAQASRVVVCAGFGSHALLHQGLALQALRGPRSWGQRCADASDVDAFPATPVNGLGNFIPQVPTAAGAAWYLGSSFERDSTDAQPRHADHLSNFAKLQTLLPQTAQALAEQFDRGQVQAFTAVRCTTPDRLPVVGEVDGLGEPGLWVSSAMGARGLTLAVLCGELLAAHWHGEPLPLEPRLAQALAPARKILTPREAAPSDP